MIYRPRYFSLQELVSPEVFEARGERAWELLDVYALVTLDQLRERFGKLTVNDWHWGGQLKYGGLRPHGAGPGDPYSQHRYGRAFDPKPKEIAAPTMHAAILAEQDKFPHLRVIEAIEATPSWVHFDTRGHTRAGVWIVNP